MDHTKRKHHIAPRITMTAASLAIATLAAPLVGTLPAFAATGSTTTTASSSTTATASSTVSQAAMTTLVTDLVTLSTKAHDGGTLATMAKPLLTMMQSSTFDWNEVLFGTDQLTASQQQTATILVPELKQVILFQTPTQSSATQTIQAVITSMQALNPKIQASAVVSFLTTLVQESPMEVLQLTSMSNPTDTSVATALHTFFNTYLVGASPDIQSLFSTPTHVMQPLPKMNAHQRAIYLNGKVVSVVPALVYGGTTYMPIWYIQHALTSMHYTSTWTGHTWDLVAPEGTMINFTKVNVGTGTMSIRINGRLIQMVTGRVAVDPSTHHMTTYMPIWYVIQILMRAGVQNTWNGVSWSLQTNSSSQVQ
ncbi:MAG: hypothetical protein OWR52_01510 [Acidibacillus sp.]|nr:hypothetical protein [Acidibacillus sp.]